MRISTTETGRSGEELAEKYLTSRGFKIMARNWRWFKYEIDLIAIHEGVVVFIEVKTRGPRAIDEGAEIKLPQRRRIIRAASAYLAMNVKGDLSCRFDLIRVRKSKGDWWIDHVQDAFEGVSA